MSDQASAPAVGRGGGAATGRRPSNGPALDGWPDWVTEFRPHQEDARDAAVDAFRAGRRVVFLDAPTGSGKTLIGEMVARALEVKSTYVCTDRALQEQVARDFPYAAVLWGRANYLPVDAPARGDVTCADCDRVAGEADSCSWCPSTFQCPYLLAQARALRARLAVLNTSYLLHAANYAGTFSGRPLVVADECDELERALMGFEGFRVSGQTLGRLKIDPPKKGVHGKTIGQWMVEVLVPAAEEAAKGQALGALGDVRAKRELARFADLRARALDVAPQAADANWVRDYEADWKDRESFVLKPVSVAPIAPRRLWAHGKKWLCMSATIISAEEMAASLGLEDNEWASVNVPMTFPAENRPIWAVPVADMSKEGVAAGGLVDLAEAVRKIIALEPEHRALVHTHTYATAAFLRDYLTGRVDSGLHVFSYSNVQDKQKTLAAFLRAENAVLLAPSMTRGVDLADDACRCVIVAKVPYPYLGDKQVNARLHTRDGRMWYAVQTARTLVQMTGRAVRNKDDYAASYILDKQFTKKFWPEWKRLFPRWWSEALRMDFDMRKVTR